MDKEYQKRVEELLQSLDEILEKMEKEKREKRRFALRHPIRYLKWRRSKDGKKWFCKKKLICGGDPFPGGIIQ